MFRTPSGSRDTEVGFEVKKEKNTKKSTQKSTQKVLKKHNIKRLGLCSEHQVAAGTRR